MSEIDKYAVTLLEQAKRYLEKAEQHDADDVAQQAFLTSSLLLGVAALEAHLNGVASELLLRPDLSILDKSILGEQDFVLRNGSFELTAKLRMYRLEDRLEFIFARFTQRPNPTAETWWQGVAQMLNTRNKIVHAKSAIVLSKQAIRAGLRAILDCLDALYQGLFRKGLPGYARGLDSNLAF